MRDIAAPATWLSLSIGEAALAEYFDADTARFAGFGPVDRSVTDGFRLLAGRRRHFGRGTVLRAQGSTGPQVFLLHSGWVASGVVVAGGARQIVKVHLPGDLMGMPSLASPAACETLQACSPVEASEVSLDAIARVFREQPALAACLFLMAQEERAALMDRMASIGRTSAINRVAALILDLHARMQAHQPDVGDEFEAPLTQEEVADVLGLTGVHVNRTLRELRTRGIAEWHHGRLRILDRATLRSLAKVGGRERRRDTAWISAPAPAPGATPPAA